MRYVVGYTPSARGADAVALASALARAQGAHLDLVYVVDRKTPYVAMNPEGSRVSAAEQEVLSAEREGLSLIPKDIEARFHVRQADSHAAGLIDAALEYQAGLIIVGA
ncbi:MAG: universal stress protein, partial [Arthrobacter sp.]|nr:universal stress protein [Arthrobacter sp.]